jgi:hypothetical protein
MATGEQAKTRELFWNIAAIAAVLGAVALLGEVI